jgi:Ni,Fe-hydrogenase I small subunit
MTKEEMWDRIEQHQKYADERGYGDAWRVMCKERTEDAARRAARAAAKIRAVSAFAAWAAYSAMDSNFDAAVEHINESEAK